METTQRHIINEEVQWDKTKTIVSKTDVYGTILYANDVFSNTCEYSTIELVGEPHNIIRHPDMPKVAFKVLWDALKKGENFHAIVKNLTRTGRYYWVITDFTIDKDEEGKIVGYTARRKAVPDGVVKKIEPIYKTLLDIEKLKGEKASEMYFDAYLKEEVGKTYNEFVVDLFNEELSKEEAEKIKNETNPLKKGLNWFFFGETNPT
ncbi:MULTISPECIES: PAS domain-containing protein [Tenacibaculum]|uniref:PAS domain-containing protein n=2 Tax=Tenacibaculum TaxID=104267 RepID=A0AAE9MP44_9FLAO|nr:MULTISPECIES: PAS domain-containing protein [Tenacibaculum]GFD71633.1 methyl-accepting chemotaxis protein [Tenacibaculum sp. KUL113]GFD78558.1 methyl-accepting chemotaxis protein [Tenacibaculum sp. KUL118]GFE02183.1 methyl-accepting chemotaxis protein [Alteromonas sp. KUL156]AZJ33181.1 PAS domain-containing protein [Tenacibaculum mesophilum]KAF9659421.1 PAS domain-containing protein [Tenacibaculum mesophilum]